MASMKTIRTTEKIEERLAKIAGLNAIGAIFETRKGVEISLESWQEGDVPKSRWREAASLLERVYDQFPRSLLQKFVLPSLKLTPEPTEAEFRMFEKKVLGTARRILKQNFEKILEDLFPYHHAGQPIRNRPTEREEAHQEKMNEICRKVRELESKGFSRTRAVKILVEKLGYRERTIWWNLKQASTKNRSTK